MTIIEFLLARIAEDESGLDAPDFTEDPTSARSPGWGNRGDCDLCGASQWDGTESVTEAAWYTHAEGTHRRSRVLAECQAKRAIVEEHPAETKWMLYGVDGDETYCAAESDPDGTMAAGQPFPCPTIRHLAAVYATHPDYDPAWRP